jgi:hypothetical protein
VVPESERPRKPLQLLVGRPGLDPGTLGLKEGCGWSDPSGEVGIVRDSKKFCPVVSDLSGDVGMVRGKLRGIFDVQLASAGCVPDVIINVVFRGRRRPCLIVFPLAARSGP